MLLAHARQPAILVKVLIFLLKGAVSFSEDEAPTLTEEQKLMIEMGLPVSFSAAEEREANYKESVC